MGSPRVSVRLADITRLEVDVVVNAANERMRGGGGVDGAIHAAAGPDVLAECIERFPHGLTTGDAGYTTAGRLAAKWIVHTVGPNYRAGQRDPGLLASCYRRSLEVAHALDAHTVAFPLISSGIFGWPIKEASSIAVRAVAAHQTELSEIVFAAFDEETFDSLTSEIRLLDGSGTSDLRV